MCAELRPLFLTVAALVMSLGSGVAAQDPVPVRITVYEKGEAGRATYHYTVTNNSDPPVTIVILGKDLMTGEFVLTPAPLGWTPNGGMHLTVSERLRAGGLQFSAPKIPTTSKSYGMQALACLLRREKRSRASA
jgi:hypothetical protein